MVYVRGHARDFDHWAEMGAAGWAFADVLPYFKRMEHAHGGEDGWRGTDGPLHVTPRPARQPALQALRRGRAGRPASRPPRLQRRQAGRLRRRWSMTIRQRPPLVGRQRLSEAGAEAARTSRSSPALARRSDHRGATRRRRSRSSAGGQIETVRARREVILAASLDQLAEAADAVRHRPAAELRAARHRRRCRPARGSARTCRTISSSISSRNRLQPITLNSKLNLFSKALIGAEWLLFKSRARRHQPFRVVRLRPLARRASTIPTSSTISCPAAIRYDGKAAAPSRMASRPMSGRCARSRAARSRCARPTRATSR